MNQPIIGEVLGITDPADLQQSFAEATHVLTDGESIDWTYDNFIMLSPKEILTQHEVERRFDLGIMAELLMHEEVQVASTLVDWPSYHWMMERNGTKADGHATALLIGAYSALSARAFTCLAREEYGADAAIVVDPISGRDKPHHGAFLYASGMEVPLVAESVDFVHTNQLLHALTDPAAPDRSPRQNNLRLFSEIARVLAPGGQLLMKELLPGFRKDWSPSKAMAEAQRLSSFIGSSLVRMGLHDIDVTLNHAVRETNYLFNSDPNFDELPSFANAAAIEVYARSRPERTFALPG
jgi:hypothetical protein